MSLTHFLSLPDLVLLDIFSYLSCEDMLYAFSDVQIAHLDRLLYEYGAYQQIRLSASLNRLQYEYLSDTVWRYKLVRSLVTYDIFADFVSEASPCQLFPSLTELRLLWMRFPETSVAQFVIAHSSTLTHLIVKSTMQPICKTTYKSFWHSVLPHLSRLIHLDTGCYNTVQIQWDQIPCLPSLEILSTFVEHMCDLYALVVDGFLPRLRKLYVQLLKRYFTRAPGPLPSTSNLCLPNLETLFLSMDREEDRIKWQSVEALTSPSVMPRLSRCTFIYHPSTGADVRQFFTSQLLNNGHKRVRFFLNLNAFVPIHLPDDANLSVLRSKHYQENYVEYDAGHDSNPGRMWYTRSLSTLKILPLYHANQLLSTGVRSASLQICNTSVLSLAELLAGIRNVHVLPPGSLIVTDPLSTPLPLVDIRYLMILKAVPGLEYLFDFTMLPRLCHIDAHFVPLFVVLSRRTNQMNCFHQIDRLKLFSNCETSFTLKHWYTILDVFPRVCRLLIYLDSLMCPPLEIADLFIDYVRRVAYRPLVLFSFDIEEHGDLDRKVQFIEHLSSGIKMIFPYARLAVICRTKLDVWL